MISLLKELGVVVAQESFCVRGSCVVADVHMHEAFGPGIEWDYSAGWYHVAHPELPSFTESKSVFFIGFSCVPDVCP